MLPLSKRFIGVVCACVLWVLPSAVSAQAARSGRVLVTVVDSSGGVIPDATVTLVGLETATKAVSIKPATTDEKGLATLDGVAPGRYSIQAEFPGFELGLVRDVRIQRGDNKHLVVLPVKSFETSVNVGGDEQTGASARDPNTFGLSLPPEQIDALSDDPTELQQQLNDLAGPDAIIRVDSFEGQQLPPKSQIKSIHVTRDQFAAETEQPGSTFIDIVTQAGSGPMRGGASLSAVDNSLAGRDPFSGQKPATSSKNYNGNYGGTIVKNKSDFSISTFGARQFETPTFNTGGNAQVLNVRQTFDYNSINSLFNYALTKNQTLKVGYSQVGEQANNEGIGGQADITHGYDFDYHSRSFRVQEAGPIGRRLFVNSRLSVNWNDQENHSAVETQALVVQGGLTTGGAQQTGGTRQKGFNLASDVDYVRGINSWRFGMVAYGGWYNTDQNSNYLGTWTFANEAAFEAGQAETFTQSVGNPAFGYFNAQGALYAQDDLRISKSLTLSPGLRYSLQTHVHDYTAFEPRFGLTWAPFKSGKTTLRASAGTFHGWLSTGTLQQALLHDGQRERELLVLNPIYDPADPNPGTSGTEPAVNKYLIGDYQLQGNVRYSAGLDQVLSPRMRVNVLYGYMHQQQLPRGENLNAPVDGVRPDPDFGNVIASVTDGEIRRHDVSVNFSLALVAPSPAVSRPRFNWRRMSLNAWSGYTRAKRDVLGAFDVPPSGSLATEWGNGPPGQSIPRQPLAEQHAVSESQRVYQCLGAGWSALQRDHRPRQQSGWNHKRPPGRRWHQ